MTQAKQSFYAVIPATVRYCKDLPPGARLLYGELTALANKEGYCWASNKYFEDLYEVGERTIRNWLEVLRTKSFIRVEVVREGFQVYRKIWIHDSSQKILPTGKILPDDRKKTSGGPEKICPQNITEEQNIRKNNNVMPKVGEGSGSSPSFSSEENQEKAGLRREVGKKFSDAEFERGFECYQEAKKTQAIRNPAAWITAAIDKKFKTKKDECFLIKEVAKKIEVFFTERGGREVCVFALNKYLEVSYPGHNCPGKCFAYEGNAFSSWWEQVRACLQRYGLPDFSRVS